VFVQILIVNLNNHKKGKKSLMKKTSKYILPALVAAFAIAFVIATPYVMAESGYGMHSYHDGAKSHKGHWAVQVSNDFMGNIPINEDSTHESLKAQVTITLSEAASKYPDAKKAKLGIAENDNGRYVVWKVIEMKIVPDSQTKSKLIHVIDAGAESIDVAATEDVLKEFDKTSHHDKWAHYKGMKDKFADMTPEEREAKFAQFKEMKEAFALISEDDRTTIMSHFKDMKGQYSDFTPEEREAKHAELKQQMEAFMGLTLDEKINYLKNLAMSFRNQA